MATNDQDITIKINVDDSGVVKVLKATGEQVESLGGKTETTNEGFSKFQATLITLNQALDLGGKVFSFLNNQLERAAVVERVSTAFDTLQGSSSLASEELGDLRTATVGLVSDFDLMKQANQAISLGLPKEEFDELAGAAVKLGAKVGQDAVGSIESLIAAVGRSSPLMLDNLGIKLKAAEAEEIYAAELKKSTDQLTEQEKATAFQQAAMIKIREAASQLQGVTITGATAYQQFTVSVTNARDAIAQLVSNSEAIKDFFKGLSFLVNESAVFIKEWAKELKDAADAANGVRIAQVREEIRSLNQEISQSEATKFGADLNLALKPERLSQIGQRLNFLHLELKKLNEEEKKGVKITNDHSGALGKDSEETKKLKEQVFELVKTSREYESILSDLKSGQIDTTEAGEQLNKLYETQFEKASKLQDATTKLKESLDAFPSSSAKANKSIGETLETLGGLEDEPSLFEKLFGNKDINEGISKKIGENITNGITNAISSIDISDIRGSIADLGSGLGTSLGAAVGQSLGPIGASIASAVGGQLGDKIALEISQIGETTKDTIGGLTDIALPFFTLGQGGAIADIFGFGDKDAGAIARDKVDAYFEDLLDADRVFLIIDGQLQEIKDLAENEFTGFFENLDTSTETGLAQFGGFDAIGLALENMFQVTDDISGQMGAVLANNVGGSLNNLQLLFQQLGIAQGDLGQAIEEAYLDGQIPATQFLETSRQIENVYAKGIPDGLGRTDLALLNIIESGGAGRQLLDGLIDLAVEAKEKQDENITSLEDLKQSLIASGEDAEKVTQLFDAIGQAGITSLEQLSDISINTAAVIGSNLESIDGFFADTSEKVEDLQRRLEALQDKEVNLTFNVKTNLDSTTRDNAGLIQEGLGGDFNLGGIQ